MSLQALKILSVDDEHDLSLLMQQMFRKEIKSGEFEFFFASQGKEALEILHKNKGIHIILADINMPIMNGLTLLKEIKKLQNPLLHVIMVSAYGDLKNIRIAMNNGAFDFVTKPIDFNDLRTTINRTAEEIALKKRKLKQEKLLKTLEADLEAGALIQNALLPKIAGKLEGFPMVDVFTYYLPAKNVSGDFYDVFPLDAHHIGFLIADVSGKGVPAAAFMLICHTAIKIYSRQGDSPGKVLQQANNYLCLKNNESMFVTAFFGILNTKTNELKYSFAGHNKPILVQNNKTTEVNGEQNIVLGVMEDYEFKENKLDLRAGDKMVMFTDGIIEPVDSKGSDYGKERLMRLVGSQKNKSIIETGDDIISNIKSFTQGLAQFDDITIVAFEIL